MLLQDQHGEGDDSMTATVNAGDDITDYEYQSEDEDDRFIDNNDKVQK